MTNINKRSMRVMMLIVFIGLITAIGLCIQRNAVENQSTTIEQAMDFDAVVLMARNDGYDLDTALQMARDAGVTSFTIYDTTLNKLTQRGELSLVTKLGLIFIIPSSVLPISPMTTTLSANLRAKRTSILMKSCPTLPSASATIRSRSCPTVPTALPASRASCPVSATSTWAS